MIIGNPYINDSFPSLNTGLLGAWNADNNAEDSIASNDGTAIGGASFATGKIGQAFSFDGINDYFLFADNDWDLTSDFTVSCWAKITTLGGTQSLMSSFTTFGAQPRGWELQQVPTGAVKCVTYNNGALRSNIISSNGVISQDIFFNLVMVREAGVGTELFLDGVSVGSDSVTVNPNYHTTQFCTIGANKEAASTIINHTTGLIDACYIWTRKLTNTEIVDGLYNSGNGRQHIF